MKGTRSGLLVLLLLLLVASAAGWGALHAAQPPQTADEEFVPIDELPPDERMPAAPFLIAAYAVAWIVVAAYLWSIWQRLNRVDREIADVVRRVQQGSGRPDAPLRREDAAAPGSRRDEGG